MVAARQDVRLTHKVGEGGLLSCILVHHLEVGVDVFPLGVGGKLAAVRQRVIARRLHSGKSDGSGELGIGADAVKGLPQSA